MILPPNTIIAAGPVIIEDGKVLLNRERKKDGTEKQYWMLPGGGVEATDATLEDACRREVREELGIDIEIIKPLRTLFTNQVESHDKAILVHYLARRIGEIIPGPETIEWGWFPINKLPEHTAPSVYETIKEL